MTTLTNTQRQHESFTSLTDKLVLDACAESSSFSELVAKLPGIVPHEALSSLRRLSALLPNLEHLPALIVDAARDHYVSFLDQVRSLPLPHPLDSEFRFTDATATSLADAIVSATRNGDEILLVGTPTVALALARSNADRVIRFVGPDDCVTAAVVAAFGGNRIIVGLEGAGAAAALVDPPWYEEPVRAMLEICARGCKPNSLVQIVMPLVGTRPEAAHDRSHYLSIAKSLGLMETGAVAETQYRTPLFELAAMEKEGLGRLASWRRGEAVELTMQEKPLLCDPIKPNEYAIELTCYGTRIRLSPSPGPCKPVLLPTVQGEVFPSISSRAPGRDSANLWTSGNRAFSVDFDVAYSAMEAIALRHGLVLPDGLTPRLTTLPAHSAVAHTPQMIHELDALIGRELEDARRLVGDGAWLTTAMGWRSSEGPYLAFPPDQNGLGA